MEHKARTKALSWLLSLAMALSLLPGMSLTAYAAGDSYVDGSGESQTVDATELAANTTSWTDGSWYIAPEGGLTISGRITVNGTVNLILRDGATLTASAGITTTNATLNIYAQSEGTGALIATGSKGCAGIGGCGGDSECSGGAGGTVSIFGGTVTATGGTAATTGYGGGAGIGGGGAGLSGESYCSGGAGGTVSIFGGTVTATGGAGNYSNAGAGIGGGGKDRRGSDGAPGTLTLGAGVKLYNGTNKTGTLLDGSDSTERTYSGSRPKNMFAEYVTPHTHNFGTSYALTKTNADNDTITATCSADGCPLNNQTATMTIVPKSDGTPTLTGDYAAFGKSDTDIVTQNGSSNFKTASITVGDKTASITYGVNCITYASGLENGTVSGDTTATVGATITPTITPAEGYELQTLTVTPEPGSSVESVTVNNGTFVMPEANVNVSATFKKINSAITIVQPTIGGSFAVNNGSTALSSGDSADYGDNITLSNTPATGFNFVSYKVTKTGDEDTTIDASSGSFSMPAYPVTVSVTFEGAPFDVTISDTITGGTVAVSSALENGQAKAGTEVTLTVTPDTGFTLDSVTVTKTADNSAVSVTKESDTIYKFTMPTEAVTVSATFVGKDTTATLAVTGNEGTTCTAKLLDANYKEIDSVTKKGGEQFILLVNRDEGYGFTVTYGSNSPVLLEEFTEEEYTAYVNYANENNLPVSSDMVLARVTMPGVTEDSVTLTVKFSKLKTFTILYQPSDTGTTAVWCKFAKSGSTTAGASRMHNDAEMGDGNKVFSLKVTAADNPDQLAFVTSESNLEGATMGNATVSQNTNSWNDITGGKYLVIGGNAKTVVAAFVKDANAIPFYNSDRGEVPEQYGAGVTYRITVVANGNPGTVTAPAAPANSEKGTVFAGWSALVGTAPNKAEIKCAAGGTVQITENTSFNATWEPKQLTVTFNSNGGTGGSDKVTVTYKDKLPELEAPTKYGFALDGWTVDKSIVQDGNLFFRGSTFDLDTGITSNMGLTAEWEHVHTYTCYRLQEVGLNWFYDDNAVHIAFCSCYDYKIMAHEYGSDGMCACGKHKPEAGKVQLDVSYVQFINGKYETKFKDKTRMEPQGKYVTLSASNLWGSDWSFTKWQYSTDEGNTWKDLAVTTSVKFGVMCNMRVRAVYEESADVKPQVELNASKYDDHFESNGTSYPMDNIAFQMSYKLPANYTFVDGGLRFGDNDGIGYYDIKERTVELSAGQNAANWAGGFVTSLLTFSAPEFTDTSYTERYYELRKNNALDEMSATALAKCIYEGKTTKAKVDPIYWDSKVKTEGNRGAIATRAPLNMTNAEEGNNWIYGIAWMRYKDADGKLHTIYTDALATTLNGIVQGGSKSVTKTAAN